MATRITRALGAAMLVFGLVPFGGHGGNASASRPMYPAMKPYATTAIVIPAADGSAPADDGSGTWWSHG